MTKLKKAVVYTALVGKYDYLRPVPSGLADIDFICFTDDTLSEKYCERKGWRLKGMPKGADTSRKGCRLLKSMPQKFLGDYEMSVWLDSNISFTSEIGNLIDEFFSSEVLIRGFRHPARNCAYLEASECVRLDKDTQENLSRMVEYMQLSRFPKGLGLTETNVLFRKHHIKSVRRLNEDWCYFLSDFTIRDQISFDFLCWKHSIDVWYFEGATHRNKHPVFSRGLHRSGNKLRDAFAYVESFQGVYPSVRKVINFLYRIFG